MTSFRLKGIRHPVVTAPNLSSHRSPGAPKRAPEAANYYRAPRSYKHPSQFDSGALRLSMLTGGETVYEPTELRAVK